MTVNLNTSLNAAQRGWGPGWPNCSEGRWVVIGHIDGVPDQVFDTARVHEILVPLVRLLIAESARRGYVFRDGQCWGAACREVRDSNPKVPSNHSWGLAVDFNSVINFLGRTDGGDIPKWMVELWNAYGFRWGGDFEDRKDPMHFEFMGTPQDARDLLQKAKRNEIGEDRMTDAEKAAFQDLKARVADLEERDDGMTRRLKGEPEPANPGPRRNGWRKADAFLKDSA